MISVYLLLDGKMCKEYILLKLHIEKRVQNNRKALYLQREE